jgi:hypothetical protein
VDGYIECLHQRPRVLTEALLARHQRVAVMFEFRLPLRKIVGETDIMVWRE